MLKVLDVGGRVKNTPVAQRRLRWASGCFILSPLVSTPMRLRVGKKSKIPSPCIDVCKFRREGHCIGCSMTKEQKKLFKSLKKPKHQAAFVEMLVSQQNSMGGFNNWASRYTRKCLERGVHPPGKVMNKVG